MKDFHLRFCLKERGWFSGLIKLLSTDGLDGVPITAGAYVLGTSDGTMLTCPWGSSPIFYIGKADALNKRLAAHREHIKGTKQDHDELSWWPRYQYGAAFGADCAYYSRRGPELAQNIESALIECFYYQFGAIPAANSSWPKKIEPKQK